MTKLGVAIGDSNGNVMATIVQISVFQNRIANLAAEAVRLGVKTAWNSSCSLMIIESELKKVVYLILNMKDSLTEIFWTISTIHYSLQSFDQSTIHHIRREYNAIVHFLTKKTLEFENPIVWMESFLPPFTLLFFSFNQVKLYFGIYKKTRKRKKKRCFFWV